MTNPFAAARPRTRSSVLAAYLVAAVTPLACGSTVAAAADMGNMPMNATPMKAAAPPPYQWTGCYVGLNGGGGSSGSSFTTAVGGSATPWLTGGDPGEVSNDGTGSHNNSNFLGGGQAGCNWQTGTVVYGLEGDFDYFHDNENFYNNTNPLPTSMNSFVIGQSLTTNYLATLRPRIRIGADRNLAYITGGVAFTDATYTESYSDSGGGVGSATASKFLTGWAAGVGWEYAWTDHLLFRFEYLFLGIPEDECERRDHRARRIHPLSGSATLVMQVARGGLNFKF